MRGHPTGRCKLANFDEIQGLVKKEARDFKLPDGSTKPWGRNRPCKMAMDQFHSKTSQQGIIQLPPGTQTQKPEEKVPGVKTSFGKLEELEFEESTHYKSDGAKRLRSGKEVTERTLPYKKRKPEKETFMDTDDEAQRLMDIARKNNYSPEPEFVTQEAPTKNVHFQDPEVNPKTPKEKAPKKNILEGPLAEEFPGS
jgi:hypothetical protein